MKILYSLYSLSVLISYGFSWEFLRFLLLGYLLLVLSAIDLETMTLPDELVLAAALTAILRLPAEGISAIPDALFGAVSVSVPLLVLILLANRKMNRVTMGGGDIKLLAALGLHFVTAQTLLLLFLACVIGIIFAARPDNRGKEIPFGPFLAAAAWICVLFGDSIIRWYFHLLF